MNVPDNRFFQTSMKLVFWVNIITFFFGWRIGFLVEHKKFFFSVENQLFQTGVKNIFISEKHYFLVSIGNFLENCFLGKCKKFLLLPENPCFLVSIRNFFFSSKIGSFMRTQNCFYLRKIVFLGMYKKFFLWVEKKFLQKFLCLNAPGPCSLDYSCQNHFDSRCILTVMILEMMPLAICCEKLF